MEEQMVQFVIAIFEDEKGAEETLSALKNKQLEVLEPVQAAVAMRKDDHNQIHYKDVGMTPTKGALAGIALGAVIGIVTGGAGLVLGAVGGLLGGVVGKSKREAHVTTEKVNQVVASIPTGSSALLTIVKSEAVDSFEEILHTFGAQTFSAEISEDLAAALNEHADAAHDTLMDQLI